MGAERSPSSTDRIASGCRWLAVAGWTMFWLFVFLLGVGTSGEVCYGLPDAEQGACRSSQALMAGAFAVGAWGVPLAVYWLVSRASRGGRRDD